MFVKLLGYKASKRHCIGGGSFGVLSGDCDPCCWYK